jgi:hypothetical protein
MAIEFKSDIIADNSSNEFNGMIFAWGGITPDNGIPRLTWANKPAPTAGNMFFCTDRASTLYRCNGSNWLTEQLYPLQLKWRETQYTTAGYHYCEANVGYIGRYNGIWLEAIDVSIYQQNTITSANYMGFNITLINPNSSLSVGILDSGNSNQGYTAARWEFLPSSLYGLASPQLNCKQVEFYVIHNGTTGVCFYDVNIYVRGVG